MKSFKILFMLAGLSSVVVASDENPTYTELFHKIAKIGYEKTKSAGTKALEFGADISKRLFEQTPESSELNNLGEAVAGAVADASKDVADVVAGASANVAVVAPQSYMTQLSAAAYKLSSDAVKNTTEFGASVVKSGSELTTEAMKNASECGSYVVNGASNIGTSVSTKASDLSAYVVKSGSELGSSIATTSSDLYTKAGVNASALKTSTVKFVEDNQTAVIVSASVATVLAVTAIVRYNMYGYVFYKSEKSVDKQ